MSRVRNRSQEWARSALVPVRRLQADLPVRGDTLMLPQKSQLLCFAASRKEQVPVPEQEREHRHRSLRGRRSFFLFQPVEAKQDRRAAHPTAGKVALFVYGVSALCLAWVCNENIRLPMIRNRVRYKAKRQWRRAGKHAGARK